MTTKQKNEILTLLAGARSDLMSVVETLKQLSALLRTAGDTGGAERVDGLRRSLLEAKNIALDDIIQSYASLLDELRAQSARILRKSLDLNDVEIQ